MSGNTATLSEKPVIKMLSLKQIKPYANNPRENREAVEKVKQSIQQYGYIQPIIVDKKNVIIAGHARYLALNELGKSKVPVIVSDLDEDKARAYRIIDNKTSEFAHWTDDLYKELQALDDLSGMQQFFTEDLEKLISKTMGNGAEPVTPEEVQTAQVDADAKFGHSEVHKSSEKEVACPNCGHAFFIAA